MIWKQNHGSGWYIASMYVIVAAYEHVGPEEEVRESPREAAVLLRRAANGSTGQRHVRSRHVELIPVRTQLTWR